MTTHSDGVNPLRPYYIPPTIGERVDSAATTNGPTSVLSGGGRNITTTTSSPSSPPRYATAARSVLSDLDYDRYINGDDTPSIVRNAKDLLDELLWKYTSVLMAQPFEVAKIILQIRDQDTKAALPTIDAPITPKSRTMSYNSSAYDYDDDSDSDGDEPAFFTSNVHSTPTPSHTRARTGGQDGVDSPTGSLRSSSSKKPALPEHFINVQSADSVSNVLSALWSKEGVWGVWKGSNATFLYTVLQSLLENWSRSFLSAIFNVPDLGVKDDIDRLVDIASPYPWASLFVASAAAVATGVLLAPLDLVRTRLIATPTTRGQRRTLANLRSLPSYTCPSELIVPTILNSLVHPVLTLSTPLVLRTRFMIDSQISPLTFSVAKFCASSAAIFVKLPLETVLRRGHMAVLYGKEYIQALGGKEQKMDTIVPIGRYNGVIGTMLHIASEEGEREILPTTDASKPTSTPARRGRAAAKTKAASPIATPTYKKGQGVEGLWRGWKVSWWGLIGLGVAGIFGNGGEGEF
ncbi:mitochondrial fusion and transport protein UGO1 [Geosmithia morbida]|uniref:Mitochondrial fusion and transport protein UGO1 n=1 Tax=Geosmithia morbida TaxID=1094350 RepID=A0A9P4YR60_9HYPO|nr:mitochondrial fusion and transport protein UGO1 [Geosmithia morbida]KAF4120565.1 mitochondrial fusion and transport protein UGO1 [Geosmithia morbida]